MQLGLCKISKRNPIVSVPDNQKNIMRDTPWGRLTYLDYKYKIEFEKSEYDKIDFYCSQKTSGLDRFCLGFGQSRIRTSI